MSAADRAEKLFLQGYNCCQAVFGAFAEEMGMDISLAMRAACSHGGGVGRLREICGAVSGAEMVLGVMRGYDTPETRERKAEHYRLVQKLAYAFKEANGSYVCRELLHVPGPSEPVPAPRTPDFYQNRPCLQLVRSAADIVEGMLSAAE